MRCRRRQHHTSAELYLHSLPQPPHPYVQFTIKLRYEDILSSQVSYQFLPLFGSLAGKVTKAIRFYTGIEDIRNLLLKFSRGENIISPSVVDCGRDSGGAPKEECPSCPLTTSTLLRLWSMVGTHTARELRLGRPTESHNWQSGTNIQDTYDILFI